MGHWGHLLRNAKRLAPIFQLVSKRDHPSDYGRRAELLVPQLYRELHNLYEKLPSERPPPPPECSLSPKISLHSQVLECQQ